MAANRETVRDALATLLTTALVGTGLPVQQVYNYRTGDFAGKSPVVSVWSHGSDRRRMTARGSRARFNLQVDIFVLYAMADGTWTEAQADDVLDAVELLIAGVVDANQVTAYWGALDYVMESTRYDVAIGGVEYIQEAILLAAEVYG